MPSPFANNKKPDVQLALFDGEIEVINSVLYCGYCPALVMNGVWNEHTKILRFTCPVGHENIVRNMEL